MCPRILDRIRLRDSSVGWVPQLLFVSQRRADPSWTLSGRHNNRATHPNRRSSSGGTRSIHAGLLVRVRVLYPARGPPVPHVGVAAHTRNSGLAWGIAGSHAREARGTQNTDRTLRYAAPPRRGSVGAAQVSRPAGARPYQREIIVPSMTDRTLEDGPGSAWRVGVPEEARDASARIGSHTVSEPPEAAAGFEERSQGR